MWTAPRVNGQLQPPSVTQSRRAMHCGAAHVKAAAARA